RTSKMGLPNVPGAVEGLDALTAEPDVDVLGVYTVRPEWLRRGQTDRQIRRRGIPVEKVTHSTNSPAAKIEALLLDGSGFNAGRLSHDEIMHGVDVRQIVLIDDSVSKVVAGAVELAEEKPELRRHMELFTLAAFSSKPEDELRGLSVPGVINVVPMRGWANTARMLDKVRNR
ncbi:MAG TPA: hypothetical protein VNA13_02900, partial [Xanthomonadales bacterium]|nr:hypothetical protein [Xanthomonadales bacterium]